MKVNHVMAKMVALLVMVAMAGCASPTLKPTMDRLTSTTQGISKRMSDAELERAIKAQISTLPAIANQNTRVMVDVFRGYVLLTGEVPNKETSSALNKTIQSVQGFRGGENHLLIDEPTRLGSQTLHEKYLKARLVRGMKAHGIDTSRYKTVVRNNTVYLMGENITQEVALMVHELQKQLGITYTEVVDVSPSTQVTQNVAQPQSPTASTYQPSANTYQGGSPYQPYAGNTSYAQNPSSYAGQSSSGYANYPQTNYSQGNQGYSNQNTNTYPQSQYNQGNYRAPANTNNASHYNNRPRNVNLSQRPSNYYPIPALSDYVRRWRTPTAAP